MQIDIYLTDLKDNRINIKMEGDKDCKQCRKSIKEIQKMSMRNKIIVIRPDYNCSGILTHYHIVFCDDVLKEVRK